MTDLSTLLVHRSHGVVRLTLNRPEKLNSISPTVVAEIGTVLDELTETDRVLVITGSGRAFCAGGDLGEVGALGSNPAVIADFHASITAVLRRLEKLPIPVICAVNGLAIAGGLELAAACDIVIAAADARFGDGHAVYGLLPGGGGSVRLPRIIGVNRAKWLMLTGQQVSAEQMREWGLVTVLAAPADLEDAVNALVDQLLTRSKPGLGRMKQLITEGLDLTVDPALANEQLLVNRHTLDRDYAEGLSAFSDKRTPNFW